MKQNVDIRKRLLAFACSASTSLIATVMVGCPSEEGAEQAFDRGIARYKKGEYEHAIADYTEAIRLQPDNAEAYYNRGYTYEQKGDQDRAANDYAKAKALEDGS